MREVIFKTWIKQDRKWSEPTKGLFHQWGSSFLEFETGPANFTVAIIEIEDGSIVEAMPPDVKFVDSPGLSLPELLVHFNETNKP